MSHLVNFFRHYQGEKGFPQLLHQGIPEIVRPMAQAAATVTSQWYDELAPDLKFEAKPVVKLPVERIDKTVDWALYAPTTKKVEPAGLLFREPGNGEPSGLAVWEVAPDVTLNRLAGSTKRMVYDASRDTVLSNAIEEGVRWARVAQPDACAFCRLLASRQAVYRTEADALTVQGRSANLTQADRREIAAGTTTRESALQRRTATAGRALRGSQQYGEKYHDHCRCIAVPVRGGAFEPPEYAQKWEQQYIDAVKAAAAAGKAKGDYGAIDIKAVLAHMRASDGGDGVGRHDAPPAPQAPSDRPAGASGGQKPPTKPPTGGQAVQGAEEPKRGTVDRSQVKHVRQHELDTADRIAELGDDVTFIPAPGDIRIADVEINGQPWELKSPTSSNPNTLTTRLGRGADQSPRIVFDLARTNVPTDQALDIARNAVHRYPDIEQIRVIGRTVDGMPLDQTIRR